MSFKKFGKLFTNKFVGTGPSPYKKKYLPGRGLTKVEKHWSILVLDRSRIGKWSSYRTVCTQRLLSAGCSVECPLSSCASSMCIKSTFGDWIFLGAFSELWTASVSFVISVRPQGTTWLPLDGFSWNLICISRKSVKKILISINMTRITGTLYETSIFLILSRLVIS
jgi:hypothetical protein